MCRSRYYHIYQTRRHAVRATPCSSPSVPSASTPSFTRAHAQCAHKLTKFALGLRFQQVHSSLGTMQTTQQSYICPLGVSLGRRGRRGSRGWRGGSVFISQHTLTATTDATVIVRQHCPGAPANQPRRQHPHKTPYPPNPRLLAHKTVIHVLVQIGMLQENSAGGIQGHALQRRHADTYGYRDEWGRDGTGGDWAEKEVGLERTINATMYKRPMRDHCPASGNLFEAVM